MLEPLTIERLKKYGFTDLQIERLTNPQKEYECKVNNNKGYFCASNITGFIYSGELGYDRFYNIGIDKFKTFEAMFQRAVQMKSIDLEINPTYSIGQKKAIYQADKSIYNSDFNFWLQTFKGFEYGNEAQYQEFLTKEVWIEYLAYKQQKKEDQQKRHEEDKESWQINSAITVNIKSDSTENNFLHSTIEDWLYPFKEENRISEIDYNILVSALKYYFETDSFPIMSRKIQVGNINKKRLGWALNQIYRAAKSDALSLNYLLFAKENISLCLTRWLFIKRIILRVISINTLLLKPSNSAVSTKSTKSTF